jgi:outer membrane protein assembly factor BamB
MRISSRTRFALLLIAIAVIAAGRVNAQWPQFRGPEGLGTAATANVPLTWSEESNVRWKTPIPGRAWSSPIVLGDQVWVSTATPDGRELSALAIDATTGKIVHDLKLFHVEKPQFAHALNSYASPTPVGEPGEPNVT